MKLARTIFGIVLSLGFLVSLAPGNPSERPLPSTPASDAHACCHKDKQPASKPQKCDGGPCSMQCCRIIPVQADSVPQLIGRTALVEVAVVVPASLHSLTDPQAIFHPPRA
jgi:hypothetical protein